MMDDNEGMTFADMIIISGQRYIEEMEQRIAALEAQNARLLALVREVANDTVVDDSRPGLPSWFFCRECHGAGYTPDTVNHSQKCKAERARALLAELEGGEHDG